LVHAPSKETNLDVSEEQSYIARLLREQYPVESIFFLD